MAKNINYGKRGYADIRTELYNFVRQYYPDLIGDFDDMSVGGMLIDLCAAVNDHLSFHTDRLFQETQLGHAQQRKSLIELAKNFGIKLPNKKAAVTVEEFTVSVPAYGDTFDATYLPILKAGTQVVGGGRVFETVTDIDFESPYSSFGTPNRLIIPVKNSVTNQIVRYDITKRELVFNGITKIYKKLVGENEPAFMNVILPENDVLSITGVIVKDGLVDGYPTDNEFFDEDLQFSEVEYLAQPYIFIDKDHDESHIKAGEWRKVTRKFITEFTDKGFCRLIFGNGTEEGSYINDLINGDTNYRNVENYLLGSSLGIKPKANSTMYVKYRVGGGLSTNVSANVLTSLGAFTITVDGANPTVNDAVKRSLRVTNPLPAFGGRDELSIEELRYMIAYHNAAQNRCVTLADYMVMVSKMDGRYGAPFKTAVYKEDNKVMVAILGLNSEGKLDNTSNGVIKANIAEWLSNYRMLNDFVEVKSGRIYNLAYDVQVYVDDKVDTTEIIRNCIVQVAKYHDINNHQMNEDIHLGNLIENINNVSGVVNVLNMKVYNKTGGNYSNNIIEMPIANEATGEITLINNTLYASKDSMFEIRNPNKDIRITIVKTNQRVF